MALCLGQITSDEVLKQLAPDAWRPRYFVALWLRTQGDTERSRSMLADALKLADKTDIRYFDIRLALTQLQ
jgi:hypothetical protein